MYFQLETDDIELEYIDGVLTVEHNHMFFKAYDHNILNIIKILNNLYPGVIIKSFCHDAITVTQDKNTLYINNTFYIDDDSVEDLITILNQANKLINGIFSMKKKDKGEKSAETV